MMNRFGDIEVSFKRLTPVYGYRSQQLVSIENALEPIQLQIEELPYYVKIAKKNCHFPSEHGLSRDESAAVYIYTMEWDETSLYRVLNNALRSENRQALKVWFPYLKLFDTALNKLPTSKEGIWRGIPIDIGKSFTKNQKVTWWSVNSCSSSVNVIKNFLGKEKKSTLFLIEAVNGKKVSGYTEYENEDEVILRMGTQFRVKSDPLEQSHGSYLVHLIEIDDDDGNEEKKVTSAMNELHVAAKPSNKNSWAPLRSSSIDIQPNAKWTQNGLTVAGGYGEGNGINQLYYPNGLYVDDDQTIYLADLGNHRIVEWKRGATSGQVVAGGKGNGAHQLNNPEDVVVDKERDSLIISDYGNKRVVRWPRQNGTSGETIISNIDCRGLTMDENGSLYVVDGGKHEVRRYGMNDTKGTLVAGGNGQGSRLDQLSNPWYVFVDRDHSVYVSDVGNHRVMKWKEGAKEGTVVAGGQGQGSSLSHLNGPKGVVVDQLGTVYVADCWNYRIMRWRKGDTQGSVMAGGNGKGGQSTQLHYPEGLSFDRQGNLYVVDWGNHRVQKFNIE